MTANRSITSPTGAANNQLLLNITAILRLSDVVAGERRFAAAVFDIDHRDGLRVRENWLPSRYVFYTELSGTTVSVLVWMPVVVGISNHGKGRNEDNERNECNERNE